MPDRPPPSFLDRATQRLATGAAAAGRLIGHAGARLAAAATPFSGQPQGAPNIPPPAYDADQPPPPAKHPAFDPKYHGHTFASNAAPLGFSGWPIGRIRAAIDQHDEGYFLESSTLAITVSRFGPAYAALGQRIAPALALPKKFRVGRVGLAKLVGAEIAEQLGPRAGLLPSIFFPPTLWGSLAIDFANMGFAILQHTYGEPDPVTGVRPIYTRRWPTWAVIYYRYRRTFQAITNDGPVDIISGDGKWTIIADSEEPHFDGAIRALGIPILDGTLTLQARSSYINKYGNPKWVGILPDKVATFGPEGDAFFAALRTIRGPDGFGALPHGADFKTVALSGEASGVFKDALDSVWQYVAAVYLGSDGTMSKGTGVYSAPIFAGIRRDLVARMLLAIVRGVNQGHVHPYVFFNYLEGVLKARDRGTWVDPVCEIPLPDPGADERIKSYGDRLKSFHEIVKLEREAGFLVDQDRVNQIAEQLDIDAPELADAMPRIAITDTDRGKVYTVEEIRQGDGYGPLGDERDKLTVAELDAIAKQKAQANQQAAEQAETGEEEAPAPAGQKKEPVEGEKSPEPAGDEKSAPPEASEGGTRAEGARLGDRWPRWRWWR